MPIALPVFRAPIARALEDRRDLLVAQRIDGKQVHERFA